MATSGGKERNYMAIFWRIENIVSFHEELHHNTVIKSPPLNLHNMGHNFSRMFFCPSQPYADDKYAVLGLDIPFREDSQECEFSFLACDGTPLLTRRLISLTYPNDIPMRMTICLPCEELFKSGKFTYLSHDSLCIRCLVWKLEGSFPISEIISVRSRIEYSTDFVLRPIGAPSKPRVPKQWDDCRIRLPFNGRSVDFDLRWVIVGDSLRNSTLFIEVTVHQYVWNLMVKLEVSLWDNDRQEITFEPEEELFPTSMETCFWGVESFKLDKYLVEKSPLLKRGKKLNFKFHLTAASGNISEYVDGKTLIPSNKIKKDINDYIPALIQLRDDSSRVLGEDFFSLYRKQKLSDFELKSGGDSFPVHKVVLSARSPYFCSLFSRDLEGANLKSLDVSDHADPPTLNRLLTFLYKGTVDTDFNLERISKLHYAADKYEVDTLKRHCSLILQCHITEKNVTDILEWADEHRDQELIKFVFDFILSDYEWIVTCGVWKKFTVKNPVLARKASFHLYKKWKRMTSVMPREKIKPHFLITDS